MNAAARALCVTMTGLVLAGCDGGSSADPEQTGPPTPESLSSCLQEREVEARERATPSWEATSEVLAGTDPSVSILFYDDEGGASGAAATLRLAGEPSIRVGAVLVIPAGPGSEDVGAAVLECLGVEPPSPGP